ncbi:MAG: MATE family efflux transporter [Planctomycetia bacterium]|nr:MATE family efflux transporter [Planctomycetia bacterium]
MSPEPQAAQAGQRRRFARKYLTASLLNLVNMLLAILIGLGLSPYILRAVGDRLYGLFAIVTALSVWFSLLDFGLGTAVSRFVTVAFSEGDADRVGKTTSTALFLSLLLATGCLLLTLLLLPVIWYLEPDMANLDTFSAVLLLFGLAYLVNFPTNVCDGIIAGVMRHDLNSWRLILFRCMNGLGCFLAIWFGGKVIALATVNLAVNTISFGIVYYLARRVVPEFRFSLRLLSRSRLLEMLSYGRYVFLSQVMETILLRFGLFLLAIMVSFEAATPYNLIIVTLAGHGRTLFLFLTSWETNWLTHLLASGTSRPVREAGSGEGEAKFCAVTEEFRESCRLFWRLGTYMAVFISFGFIAWGRAFIERWIGPAYLADCGALVLLMVWFGLCYGAGRTNYQILLATARHRFYAWSNAAHALAFLLLGVVFLAWGWGVFGVVLAEVLPGFLIQFLIIPLYTTRIVGQSLRGYAACLTKAFLVSLLAASPGIAITACFVEPSYCRLLLLGLACSILYFAIIGGLGLTRDERRRFCKLWRRGDAS